MAGNSSQIKAGGAYVVLGGDDTQLKAALDRAAAKLRSFSATVTAMGREVTKIGLAIVTPIGLAAKTFESMGSAAFFASQRTGASVEALSRLGYAAQQSGANMEDVETSIKRMQRSIVDAAQGSQQGKQAFDAMGISLGDLTGLSADQQFLKIGAALEKVHDPTVRAGLAMEVFGRNGTQLLPLLNQGADGLQQMMRRADALGIVIGGPAAEAAERLHGRVTDLSDVLKNSFFRAGEAVAPVLTHLIDVATRGVVVVNRWITAHKDVVVKALEVGAAVTAAGVGMLALGQGINIVAGAFSGLGTAAGLARSVFSIFPPLLTAMLNPVALVGAAVVGLGGYFLYATDAGRTTFRALGDYFRDLADTATEAFGGIRDALAAGDWKLAADVAFAGLKLAFAQGIAPLKTAWIGITSFMQTTWANLGGTLAETWFRAIAAVKDALAGFLNFYKTTMAAAGGFLSKEEEERRYNAAHSRLVERRSRNEISQADYDKLSAAEDAYHAKQLGAVDNSTSEQLNKFDAEMKKAAEANDADLKQKLANIEQTKAADLKRIGDQSREQIDANQADLDDKQKKLDDLRKQAQQKGGGKGLFGALPVLPPAPALALPGIPDAGDLAGIMAGVKAAGTFSARGATGFGGGNLAQRQLSATEKIAKLTEESNRTAKDLAKAVTAGLTLG